MTWDQAFVLLVAAMPFLCAGFYHWGAFIEREKMRRRAERNLRALNYYGRD